MMRYLQLLILVLTLQGCAYYTKDTYYGPVNSHNWKSSYFESERSEYSCGNKKAKFVSFNIESHRTAYAFIGIPILPAFGTELEFDQNQPVIIDFMYTGNELECNHNDVSININTQSEIHKPREKDLLFYNKDQNFYYCRYWFNQTYSDIAKINVHLSKDKLGCEITPLTLIKASSWSYNFQPW